MERSLTITAPGMDACPVLLDRSDSTAEAHGVRWLVRGTRVPTHQLCGDPPAGVSGAETPPTAEGGALRSQSLRRASGEPALLNGSIIRVDPATGNALPTNPLYSSSDANARRIVGYGFRNPFRFTIRPGTSQIWAGDVGWNTWENLARIDNPMASPVKNLGWPCYEGPNRTATYSTSNLDQCTKLYGDGTRTAPYYTDNHGSQVVPGEACPTGSTSITGVAFNQSTTYPSTYTGALFFADYSRNCIWAMLKGANGDPDPSNIVTLEANASTPIDLETGPNGDLSMSTSLGETSTALPTPVDARRRQRSRRPIPPVGPCRSRSVNEP